MTLTVEVTPEQEAWLREQAAAKGQGLETLAASLLAELIEDLQDVEEAQRRLADSNEPNIPWAEFEAELDAGRGQNEAAA